MFYQILNQPLDVAAMEKAGVPPEIRELVMQATAKDPAARPQNFGVIIAALRDFLNQPEGGAAASASSPAAVSPATARPPARVRESPAGPILRLSVIVYGLVGITTVLAIGTWFWMGKPKPSDKSAAPPAKIRPLRLMERPWRKA